MSTNQCPEPRQSPHPNLYYDKHPTQLGFALSALIHCVRQAESPNLSFTEGSFLLHISVDFVMLGGDPVIWALHQPQTKCSNV